MVNNLHLGCGLSWELLFFQIAKVTQGEKLQACLLPVPSYKDRKQMYKEEAIPGFHLGLIYLLIPVRSWRFLAKDLPNVLHLQDTSYAFISVALVPLAASCCEGRGDLL